ncbi:MAG: chorismate-binding protein [Cryomorphaceae bacterium]|nr:chorismate-binding protein [Cryomorphaceae bacterium]
MSNAAFFACKQPHTDVSNIYQCHPSDEANADLIWGDYEAKDIRFYKRERIKTRPEACQTLPLNNQTVVVEKEDYLSLVERARKTIEETQAKKIVLSRTQVVDLPNGFDTFGFYERLCKAFPTAFVYLFNAEGVCWMGATPELLLHQNGQHIKTMSLAGTRWINDGKHAEWTEKEREEQAWVTTFLREELRGLGVVNIEEVGPKTLQAGHLQHLCTELNGHLPLGVTPRQAAAQLHPTPAVCGYPRHVAREFIHKHEAHDRSFYAGYMGVKEEGNAHFFVNLRCMQVFDKQAVLFAGGGITADSNAETEWEETEQKLDVLRQLIQNT